MSILKATIPIGLGDLIYLKAALDSAKYRYKEIHLRFHRDIIPFYHMDTNYNKFLDDMGALFFSEPPYVLTDEAIPFYGIVSVFNDNAIHAIKPDLRHLLCRGTPVNVDSEYIAIVTKTRYMPRAHFDSKAPQLFEMIRKLSNRYKIVILGEREVQMNEGYIEYRDGIYSIYNDIIKNVPTDKIIDLTVPALGITAPDLKHIQQDSVTLSGAKCVITIGVGGGMSLATAVSNVVGYRIDQDPVADSVFAKEYPDALVTKDFGYFISRLSSYQ